VPASAFQIDRLPVPEHLDGEEGAAFREMVEVRNLAEAQRVGSFDLAYSAEELHPFWTNPYEPKTLYVARVDGRIVGRGVYETRLDQSANSCWLEVDLLEEFWGRRIEEALHARVMDEARAAGRGTANFYAAHRETGSSDRIAPPTGFGSIPADDALAVFLAGAGYVLGQVERRSRLPLPADTADLEQKLAAATSTAGEDYRVVYWEDVTPEEWVPDVALLNTRMSTDAPIGAMTEEEDQWDDARVRADDALSAVSPRRLLVAAVLHVPTGRLAGFNELSVPAEASRPVSQEDTLVLREHRGRRLGMLLKAANLLRLEREAPGHPSVITFNAEENRPMLAVNEAVGFVAVGYEGGWTREV